MEEKWVFRDVETKNFVEELINDRERELSNVDELVTKMNAFPLGDEHRELYENLITEAKDRVEAYEGMIKELTTEEQLLTAEEIAEEQSYEAMSDENYWQMLMKQADKEISETAEDVLTIKDSVEDAQAFAEEVYKELNEMEMAAEAAIKQVENALSMSNSERLQTVYDILKDGPNKENLLTKEDVEAVKAIEETLKDWRPILNSVGEKNLQKAALEGLDEKMISTHPIGFAITQLRDTVSQIRDAKLQYRNTQTNYFQSLKNVSKAVAIKMTDSLSPIKTTVVESARSGLDIAANALNDVSMKFVEFADKTKGKLTEGIRSLLKFADKVMDAVTFGGYSKVAQAIEKHNDKVVASKTGSDVGALYGIFSFSVSMRNKIRGVNSENYWKDVQDNAFLWGNLKDAEGKITGYEQSPVQDVCDVVKKSVNAGLEFGRDTAEKCANTATVVKDSALEFTADTIEKMAGLCDKRERRLQSKVDQLTKVDHEIFEINVQLKQAMHKLNEVTPFKRPEYEPNAQITQAQELLKKMEPSHMTSFLQKSVDKELKKEQRKFERQVNKDELVQNAKHGLANLKASMVAGKIARNESKGSKNFEKLTAAQEKLGNIAQRKQTIENVANVVRKEVSTSKQTQEKESSDIERD